MNNKTNHFWSIIIFIENKKYKKKVGIHSIFGQTWTRIRYSRKGSENLDTYQNETDPKHWFIVLLYLSPRQQGAQSTYTTIGYAMVYGLRHQPLGL